MKLLLAESGTTLGGTERVVWEIATRLPSSRYEVAVWLADAPGVDELAASLAARGIAVTRVAEVDSRWDWAGMLRTFRALRRHAPALLHIHHVWPAADRYLPAIARAAGVPHVVVTEHIVGRSHSGAQRALKRRELDRADAVTTVCGAVADSLVRDYGVERARLRVVPNGADPPDEDDEHPAARRLRDELGAGQFRPLWVCAGRLEEQKGHAVLIDALAQLKSRSLDFVCAIAGNGALRQALERRAESLGLGRSLRFLGQIEAIGPLLAAADACVLPSLWEGLPLTLLEAMARGRPTIASAVGGIPEVVDDGVTGRLVPPGDVGALAAALEDFHRRPAESRVLGAAAAAEVRAEYTWPRVVERFEAVYDEVLGLASFAPEHRRPARAAARGGAR
ncbi:MAG: glycosyltransferase [Candidatus Eisenbacteria bacterium]|nr:glycosyltransferase [Candidatus Eisenbacteria bacterium]